MPLKIKMYSDFICPFCYIGFEVFRKLKPEFDLELDWRGFQIHPEWPAEGMLASEWRNGMDPAARQAVWQRIQAMAVAAGFEMKPPELLTNSRLSLEAAEFAKEAGVGEAFDERVYRAYFYEGIEHRQAERPRRSRRRRRPVARRPERRPRFRPLRAAPQEQCDGRASERRQRCADILYR